MRIRRTLYGWEIRPGFFCLSRVPPDQPQLPALVFASIDDAEQCAKDRRASIIWSGTALIEHQIRAQG